MANKNNKRICVVGLGYIGLPTASMFATHGASVLGVDTDPAIIKTLQQGQVHIHEPGLATVVRAAISSGQLTVGTKPEPADVFIIAVPTPIKTSKGKIPKADMSYVKKAVKSIQPHLKKGNLVILESTSPPGTTRDLILPMVGKGVGVAYCPERVIPGQALKELIGNDRVVGAINEEWGEKVRRLYKSFVSGDIFLTDPTTAEMVKLLENTYRDVNIALANEVSVICEKLGVNVWEVIQMANRHPRVHVHKPGPGVGGHCIGVDPWFLVDKFEKEANVIRTARAINEARPEHVVSLIQKLIGNKTKAKVTLLGLAYKGNVDDMRESPSVTIIRKLQKSSPKLELGIYDPHIKTQEFQTSGIKEAFKDSDLAVLLTPHEEFRFIDPDEISPLMRNRVILDTHNYLKSERWIPSGYSFFTIGTDLRLALQKVK